MTSTDVVVPGLQQFATDGPTAVMTGPDADPKLPKEKVKVSGSAPAVVKIAAPFPVMRLTISSSVKGWDSVTILL